MARENIILTGFMGTGKTTVGKLLARKLEYQFVDTDEWIQSRAAMGIPDIFQNMGEAAFRKMETDVAMELGRRDGMVIATGGRLMLDPENAAALGRTGRVFCLVASAEEILSRVSEDTDFERPLLAVSNPLERIVVLLSERQDGYGRFPQVGTSRKTPEEVAQYILNLFEKKTAISETPE